MHGERGLPIEPGDMRVSTRFPTGVKATENPLTHHLTIGTDEMKRAPGFHNNVELLTNYPGFERLEGHERRGGRAGLSRAGHRQHAVPVRPFAARDEGALAVLVRGRHAISDALAHRWGVPRQSSSAALASLSPQMDWFKNASLGERVGDIVTSAAAGRGSTPEMTVYARSDDPRAEGADAGSVFRRRRNAMLCGGITGKSLDQLETRSSKALWIRLYDEAHNPRRYRSVTPEGNFGDFVRQRGDGEPSRVLGGVRSAKSARRCARSRAAATWTCISPLLGSKHKVRSFYNNIEVPNDPRFGDVTGDTHQVAAASCGRCRATRRR